MPNYRRYKGDGGCFFFTVALEDRSSRFLIDHIDDVREAYGYVQQRKPFKTHAICILPDHIHAIWGLPDDESDYATRWMLFKSFVSRRYPKCANRSPSKVKRGESGLWQRRFWEHMIRDDQDFENHLGYMYWNPVKHGYVETPEDWPYTSLHRDTVPLASLAAPYEGFTTVGER